MPQTEINPIDTSNAAEKPRFEKTYEVLQYISSKGFDVLSDDQVIDLDASYRKGLELSMEGNHASGLSMTDSKIKHVPFESLTPNEQSLVFVIGGTNVRVALVSIGLGGVPKVTRDEQQRRRYAQTNIPGTLYPQGPEAFYSDMTGSLSAFLDSVKPEDVQGVGIIYSFSGNPIKGEHMLDMIPDEVMGKGFLVPGIGSVPVGETIFNTEKMKKFKGIRSWAVMNDMPPVCVATESKIGVILATGLNISVAVNGTYYVTECGHFKDVPTNEYATILDEQSNNKGHGLTEKQTSGRYLGELFGLVINDLREKKYIDIDIPNNHRWVSEDVGGLVNDANYFHGAYSDEQTEILRAVANLTVHRSAQIVGTLIGSSIHTYASEFSEGVVNVPVEGALLWRINGYKEIAKDYASFFAGHPVRFVEGENLDVVGAGVVALSQ